jgi:hypothetical protein
VLASSQSLTDQKSWHDVTNVGVNSIFSIDSVRLSRSTVLTSTNISLVLCGSRLTRY